MLPASVINEWESDIVETIIQYEQISLQQSTLLYFLLVVEGPMRICRVCHDDEEMRPGVMMMKRDISCMTEELETQSQKLEEVWETCDKTQTIVEDYMEPYIVIIKEELETQRKKLEEVWKVCEKTHESVENILKELQKQQNSRTESATGRKRSKEKEKVDPLCRVSHLPKE